MLRRMIGDEPFRNGLRRFYREWRFRKAGTDDLRAAFEAEGASLDRFFDRWIWRPRSPRAGHGPNRARGRYRDRARRTSRRGRDFPLTVVVQYADGRTEHTRRDRAGPRSPHPAQRPGAQDSDERSSDAGGVRELRSGHRPNAQGPQQKGPFPGREPGAWGPRRYMIFQIWIPSP